MLVSHKAEKPIESAFFISWEGRDTHVTDILLKRKLKMKEGMSMNEKLVINTNLLRKESEFKTKACVVEKAIVVPHSEFDDLKRNPLQDNDLIADNVDLMFCDSDDNYHCLLIYDEEYGDGLVADSEGFNYLRYAGYIPNAKLLYENHIFRRICGN